MQEKAKEKADSMVKLLGYPTWLKDKAELDKFYDGVGVLKQKFILRINFN